MIPLYWIDWLSMRRALTEEERQTLPVVGTEYIVRSDVETGELTRMVVTGYQHPGSYDSSIHVRCDGEYLEISGNPSRFNRPDNLFGWSDPMLASEVLLRAAEQVIPSVDSSRALPRIGMLQSCESFARNLEAWKVTRVDVTTMHAVGEGNVRPYLRYLSQIAVRYRGPGTLYPNGATVDWGKGSRRTYLKAYDKSVDIEVHLKIAKTDQHREYLAALLSYAMKSGLVRSEITIKSNALADLGCNYLIGLHRNWHNGSLIQYVDSLMPHNYLGEWGEHGMNTEDIYHRLYELASGTERQKSMFARQVSRTYAAWRGGEDVNPPFVSLRTFYRHRSALRELGIDITERMDITRLPLQVRRINVSAAVPPSWYKMPDIEVWRKAA